jgi:hypothetical protein
VAAAAKPAQDSCRSSLGLYHAFFIERHRSGYTSSLLEQQPITIHPISLDLSGFVCPHVCLCASGRLAGRSSSRSSFSFPPSA